jgi:maltooligosyltrehalose trehalohydrolase
LLRWHRELIRLRKQSPELTDDRLDRAVVKFDEDARWLTMSRGAVVVAINCAQEAQSVPLIKPESHKLLLASHSGILVNADSIEMPAESVAVVRI